jgi:geranylgeranyl pyrophosphate synthase
MEKIRLAHGINIGDYLYTQVFEAFLLTDTLSPQVRIDLLKLLMETLDQTHVGQAQDINALACDSITLDQYLDIVTHKTGYYLAAPMIGGARIAQAAPPNDRGNPPTGPLCRTRIPDCGRHHRPHNR